MAAQPCLDPQLPEEEGLTCDIVPARETVHVYPRGALDLSTVAVLEDRLTELRAAGFRSLIVDLRELSFMDSTGLRLVLRWQSAAEQDGFAIGFVAGPPPIQRVFELTGTTERIAFVTP